MHSHDETQCARQGLTPELEEMREMAGDRGLAFVIIGLIGASLFSRLDSIRSRPPKREDAQFLSTVAGSSIGAITLGRLAEQRGGRAVRELGKKIAGDYRSFQDRLRSIAALNGFTVTAELDWHDRATYLYLSSLDGPTFDQEFTANLRARQKAHAAALRQEADHGVSLVIRQFAQETLWALPFEDAFADTPPQQ
jgi:hypothetical protein